MKASLVSTLSIVLLFAASAVPVQAQYVLEDFAHSVKRDFKRNNCWPEPFVRPDRVSVRVPFALMVHAGWQQQNLLGLYHFKENGAELNEAGQLKVRSILAETPPHHRTIYLQRAISEEQTAARMETVQELVAKLSVNSETPSVVLSSAPASGWPADEVDAIGRKFQASAPQPRLPEAALGGEK